jgi:hypothetical protein
MFGHGEASVKPFYSRPAVSRRRHIDGETDSNVFMVAVLKAPRLSAEASECENELSTRPKRRARHGADARPRRRINSRGAGIKKNPGVLDWPQSGHPAAKPAKSAETGPFPIEAAAVINKQGLAHCWPEQRITREAPPTG